MAILSNSELFWKHAEICKICDQHPQSVASFYYEPMCLIGRGYSKSEICFTDLPDIANFNFYLQDSAGLPPQAENWPLPEGILEKLALFPKGPNEDYYTKKELEDMGIS